MTALNPVLHGRRPDCRGAASCTASRPGARRATRAVELLDAVRIPDPARRARRLSASALRRHAPARADRDGARLPSRRCSSPTSRPRRSTSRSRPRSSTCCASCGARSTSSLLLITHDLGVIARDGRPRRRDVRGPHRRGGAGARHVPRARASVHAGPARVDSRRPRRRAAAGHRRHGAARSATLPPGCAFAPRCPSRFDACDAPRRRRARRRPDHRARCCCTRHADAGRRPIDACRSSRSATSSRTSRARGGLFGAARVVRAVDDVSFAVEEGETFGLVGESGSGKTHDRPLHPAADRADVGRGPVPRRGRARATRAARCGAARRDMQIVFQDPYSSLNPRMRVARHRRGAARHPPASARSAERRGARGGAASAGRPRPGAPASATRTSSAAASASASASRARWRSNPSFIVADEPVSALDVSIQAQVVNLLMDLQAAAAAHLPVHRARPAAGASTSAAASR